MSTDKDCIICKAPLEYLEHGIEMECVVCGKKQHSKTRCVNGHFVCDQCHTDGIDEIFGVCHSTQSRDPIRIMNRLMSLPFCHMHGPEHHIMVGAALLTAYKNSGGDINLAASLSEIKNRGQAVPGGACGFWGACGAGVSTGIFVSIALGATPLSQQSFAFAHQMTAKALKAIGDIGGPRCCKRDSYLSIMAAAEFVKENLGIEMECSKPICGYSKINTECINERCPFHI